MDSNIIVLTGHNYSNSQSMITNIFAVIIPVVLVIAYIIYKDSKKPKITPTKCGCGNTKNVDGYCDGSHNDIKKDGDGI